jgi:hypothetical protein
VYWAKSGKDTLQQLIHPPQGVDQHFTDFLYTLGWPVRLDGHRGFKGSLTAALCPCAPYYADQGKQVIFHVPYLTKGSPSRTVEQFKEISQHDRVAVVWMEDTQHMAQIQHTLGGQVLVCLVVQPLPSAPGLYVIRLLHRKSRQSQHGTKASEERIAIGPLVDGMIVGRRTLGKLVRNTAISAHLFATRAHNVYTSPHVFPYRHELCRYALRQQIIQDITVQYHKPSKSLSEFYTQLFSN